MVHDYARVGVFVGGRGMPPTRLLAIGQYAATPGKTRESFYFNSNRTISTTKTPIIKLTTIVS